MLKPSTIHFCIVKGFIVEMKYTPHNIFIVDSPTSGHIALISLLVKYPNFPSILNLIYFVP